MEINKDDLNDQILIDEKKLIDISETILKDYYEEIPDVTLSFVSEETIRELNRTYRAVDSVTDVLSFEADGETDPETGKEYLGDIIICPEQAVRQAELSGHPFENEVELLEIHGLLHLLGYDHIDDVQKEEMWHFQNFYLEKCGVFLKRRPGEDFDF